MRRLLPLLAIAACGDAADPTPVDMIFRVSVAELENSCDGGALRTEDGILVDVALKSDGSMTFYDGTAIIPGPYDFPDLRAEGGRVSHGWNRAAADGRTYPYRMEGDLSMDGIDVVLTEHWYRPGDHGDCVRSVRISGAPRGFLDPASLDGVYEIAAGYHGVVCGSDPWPAAASTFVYTMDVRPTADSMVLSLARAVFLEPPLPAADGSVDWDGTVWYVGVEGIDGLSGGLHGRFGPDAVRADLTFATLDLAPGCFQAYRLDGRKRSAAGDEVGSDYRAVVRVRDGCEGTVETFESWAEAVRQGQDEIQVSDAFGDWYITADGAALQESDGSPSEGVIATFTGTASPPYLSYTLEFQYYDFDGNPDCTYAWDVDAVVRFHPEFGWVPAYAPDPPDDAAQAAARIVNGAPPMVPFRKAASDFGPLARP